MSDRNALLSAILANPDEDAPRLIFADWLQEHGEPERAEFIRVQIELAHFADASRDLPGALGDEAYDYTDGPNPVSYHYHRHYDPRRIELLRREAELLSNPDHRNQWQAGLPKYAGEPDTSERLFRRGFVGNVRVSLAALLKDPEALWAHHPVESLTLTAATGRTTTAKVPRSSFFQRVRELIFPYSGSNFPLLAPFAKCPHLANLHTLRLLARGLSEADMAAFAASEHLRPVRLSFKCYGLPRESFEKLVNSPFASQLRDLDPESVGEWAPEVLAAAPLGTLRKLRLDSCGCGDAGVVALTRSPHLKNVVTLGLAGNNLTDESAEALAAWPGLASVRSLDLTDSDITGAGVEALVASPSFQPVFLNLSSTSTGDIGAAALARWPGLANVRFLDLRYAQVCDTGGLAMARSPHWRDIRCLILSAANFRRAHGPLNERLGNAFQTGY